jgi:hypothetical protein
MLRQDRCLSTPTKLDLLDPSKTNNPTATDFATQLLQLQDAMKFQFQEA